MPKFRKGPIVIDAVRMDHPFSADTPDGKSMQVDAGDWLITTEDGEQYTCQNAIFNALYEQIDATE